MEKGDGWPLGVSEGRRGGGGCVLDWVLFLWWHLAEWECEKEPSESVGLPAILIINIQQQYDLLSAISYRSIKNQLIKYSQRPKNKRRNICLLENGYLFSQGKCKFKWPLSPPTHPGLLLPHFETTLSRAKAKISQTTHTSLRFILFKRTTQPRFRQTDATKQKSHAMNLLIVIFSYLFFSSYKSPIFLLQFRSIWDTLFVHLFLNYKSVIAIITHFLSHPHQHISSKHTLFSPYHPFLPNRSPVHNQSASQNHPKPALSTKASISPNRPLMGQSPNRPLRGQYAIFPDRLNNNFQQRWIIVNKKNNFNAFARLNIIIPQVRKRENMSSTFTRKKIQTYSYGLHDAIGKGYSSQVYKGRSDQTGQPVAVKVIDLRMLKNQINKILLQSEIQILKELKSLPHVLSLHEVYTTKNNTYIITELCDSDLNKTLKKGLSQPQAIDFMQQILTGYLHFARKDIIHRDLKPANILITDSQQLKIADFGFAIKTADALKSNKYNVGSPLYMAPESLKRNQYTLKTDIWALGVIFFEMLMGETPWKAKNQKELVRKIQNQKIDDLVAKLHISPISKQFLKKTLRTNKNDRMTLEELSNFSFQNSSNILAQKKLNIELRSVNITQNMSLLTPKTQKNIQNRMLVDRNNTQNRKGSRQHSINKFNSFRNESINHSIQLKPAVSNKYNASFRDDSIRKEPSGKQNPENPSAHPQPTNRNADFRQQKKTISKILVSQIHFCRFLFKLLSKISQSYRKGLLQHSTSEVDRIMRDYTCIIKHKIQNLVKFNTTNFINTNSYEDYKDSSDYAKLMKIAREYKERYSQELKEYWGGVNSSKVNFTTSTTVELIEHMYKLLHLREHQDNFVESNNKEIVVLDYLITSKQLIQLFKNGQNYERFSRKSRIEEIVEGKTADISRELYYKIMNRAKEVTMIHTSNFCFEMEQKMMLAV